MMDELAKGAQGMIASGWRVSLYQVSAAVEIGWSTDHILWKRWVLEDKRVGEIMTLC